MMIDEDEAKELESGDDFIHVMVTDPHKVGDGMSSYIGEYSSNYTPFRNERDNLFHYFSVMKSSKTNFIFLPAFYLIMWLMKAPKNFEKILILKM